MRLRHLFSMVVFLGAAAPLRAQDVTPAVAQTAAPARAAVPFMPGERATYDVKFGLLKVGSGRIEVMGTADVRGHEAWHTRFSVRGGIPGFHVNDLLESWLDTRTLSSLRFVQDYEEGSHDREKHYEIFPEHATYVEEHDGKSNPSVSDPLDDGAVLFYVRTLPLEVGHTYELNRYFKPDRNPVTIQVLRRERVKVPAGTFDAIVVQPVIKSKGLFNEKSHAEVWLSDDPRRLLLQMKAKVSIGTLSLYLKSYEAGGMELAERP